MNGEDTQRLIESILWTLQAQAKELRPSQG